MSGREECIGNPVAEVIWLDDTHGDDAAVPQSAATLSIGHVAQVFEVSPWTLRYYELRGMIARRQRIGGTRVYSWADCDRIALIVKCRRAGIGLADIAPILRAVDDDAPARTIRVHQMHCKTLIESTDTHRKVYDEALSELMQIDALLGARLDAGANN